MNVEIVHSLLDELERVLSTRPLVPAIINDAGYLTLAPKNLSIERSYFRLDESHLYGNLPEFIYS